MAPTFSELPPVPSSVLPCVVPGMAALYLRKRLAHRRV